MSNHRWKDNVCIHCGLHRMMQSWKIRMSIQPDSFKYGKSWYYGYPNSDKKEYIKGIGFNRPDCKNKNPCY